MSGLVGASPESAALLRQLPQDLRGIGDGSIDARHSKQRNILPGSRDSMPEIAAVLTSAPSIIQRYVEAKVNVASAEALDAEHNDNANN